MSIETKPNLKQQVSRERAVALAIVAGRLDKPITIDIIANEGESVPVSYNKSFKVKEGNVGIDIHGGQFDGQILSALRQDADQLQPTLADKING